MKKLLSVTLMLVLALSVLFSGMSLGSPSYAQDEPINRLVVRGQASYEVTPDIAYVNIGVETKNADANEAQTENANKMASVRKALKNIGIKKEDLKTSRYSVYSHREYLKNDNYKDVYVVSNELRVTVRDLKQVATVIDQSSKSGANVIRNVNFAIQDEEAAYKKALQMAIKNANGKADAILSTFGKKVGMPIRITENSYGGVGYMRADNGVYNMENKVGGMATPIEQGKLNITATVMVEYDYSK